MKKGRDVRKKERGLRAGSVIELSFQDWYRQEDKRNGITFKTMVGFPSKSYYDVKTELIILSFRIIYK
jgi:hypothetical protein